MIGINVQIAAKIANNSLHWTGIPLRSISASDAIRSFAVLVDRMANKWACLAVAIRGTFSGVSFHWNGGWIPFTTGFARA